MLKLIYMGRQMGISVSLFFVIIAFSLFFAGCKTVPQFKQDLSSVIIDSGDIVFTFNLDKDRRVIEYVLSTRGDSVDYKRILERTGRIILAVKADGTFTAAAEGNYPYIASNWMLCSEKEWIRHKGSYVWWENRNTGESVSVPVKNFALYSDKNLDKELKRLKNDDFALLPSGPGGGGKECSFGVNSINPKVNAASLLGLDGVEARIEDMDLDLYYDEESSGELLLYRMGGYITFADEKNAAVFFSAFKIGFLRLARKISQEAVKDLIKGKRFSLEGRRIIFDGVLINIPDLLKDGAE